MVSGSSTTPIVEGPQCLRCLRGILEPYASPGTKTSCIYIYIHIYIFYINVLTCIYIYVYVSLSLYIYIWCIHMHMICLFYMVWGFSGWRTTETRKRPHYMSSYGPSRQASPVSLLRALNCKSGNPKPKPKEYSWSKGRRRLLARQSLGWRICCAAPGISRKPTG